MSLATALLWLALLLIVAAAASWAFRALLVATLPRRGAEMLRDAPLTGAFGMAVVLLYGVFTLFAPALAPYGQLEAFDLANALPGDDPRFVLGTDEAGRDLASRLVHGGRNTIVVALLAAGLGFAVGALAGFFAAAVGGWPDAALSRGVSFLTAIPQLVFALLLIAAVGFTAVSVVLVIAALEAAQVFRGVRGLGREIARTNYVEAANLRGETLPHVVFAEILPNAALALIAQFGQRFCTVLLLVAALSFFGFGLQPPLADLGRMARELGPLLGAAGHAPSAALLPGAAIALLALAVHLAVAWLPRRVTPPAEDWAS